MEQDSLFPNSISVLETKPTTAKTFQSGLHVAQKTRASALFSVNEISPHHESTKTSPLIFDTYIDHPFFVLTSPNRPQEEHPFDRLCIPPEESKIATRSHVFSPSKSLVRISIDSVPSTVHTIKSNSSLIHQTHILIHKTPPPPSISHTPCSKCKAHSTCACNPSRPTKLTPSTPARRRNPSSARATSSTRARSATGLAPRAWSCSRIAIGGRGRLVNVRKGTPFAVTFPFLSSPFAITRPNIFLLHHFLFWNLRMGNWLTPGICWLGAFCTSKDKKRELCHLPGQDASPAPERRKRRKM